MRMWGVNTKLMCDQHLLGEHLEMHMFAGSYKKGIRLYGYIRNGLVETGNIEKRHNELVEEMIRRGFNHQSPLHLPRIVSDGKIDIDENLKELAQRCLKCRKLITQST
jgi:hypothetical protein